MPTPAQRSSASASRAGAAWPALPLAAWRETCDTLHLWTQIIGKVRLALAPMMNEWWQVPLYVTARGLTTSPIPHGDRAFEIDLDLFEHRLLVTTSDGARQQLPLGPRSVASLYRHLMNTLDALGLPVSIGLHPVETSFTVPLDQDEAHASYDPVAVRRFHRILVTADALLKAFRSRFRGKASPVHFYWGTFDLAVALHSGRRSDPPPRAGRIERVAFDEELFEAGFWPGDERSGDPAFFALHHPPPAGMEALPLRPAGARFDRERGLFLLPYEQVRAAAQPAQAVLEFLGSTYASLADLARWPRDELERPIPA